MNNDFTHVRAEYLVAMLKHYRQKETNIGHTNNILDDAAEFIEEMIQRIDRLTTLEDVGHIYDRQD